MQLLIHGELTTFRYLSFRYRQHHKGQRLRGDDADWLRSNGHQDPPHQIFHHPTFAPGQPHRHILPAPPDWKPGRASCWCAYGVCLRSPAAPVLFMMTPEQNPWRQTEEKTSVGTFFVCDIYFKFGVLPLTEWLWFRFEWNLVITIQRLLKLSAPVSHSVY